MRSWVATAVLGTLVSTPALAQADRLFRTGPPVEFREADIDRRFERTRFGRALSVGSPDPSCQKLLGGMFTLLAEAAPRFHKRDENFYLDPVLVQGLVTQLSTPAFPANVYFAEMVRRVRIEGHMPAAWLEVARQSFTYVPFIDLSKLEYLTVHPQFIDAMELTVPLLLQRHQIEVAQANSSVVATALESFREAYLDRDVAWGGLTLADIVPAHAPAPRTKNKAQAGKDPGLLGATARLEIRPPKSTSMEAQFLRPEKSPATLEFTVHLAPRQYIDLKKLPKGSRVLVRGRLFDFNPAMTHFELRDAQLFEDRDFSQGFVLGDPAEIAGCALARNDLNGTGEQVGGFKRH